MNRSLLFLNLLAVAGAAAAESVVLDDRAPRREQWACFSHVSLGPEGRNAGPNVETDGAALHVTAGPVTNSSPDPDHLFDHLYLVRRFDQPVPLAEGETLVAELRIEAPIESGNVVRDIRGLQVCLIGAGEETVPAQDTRYGVVGGDRVRNGLDFELAGTSAVHVGATLAPGRDSCGPVANGATNAVGSKSLFLGGPALFADALHLDKIPAEKLSGAWTGNRLVLEIERTQGDAGNAAFRLVVRGETASGEWVEQRFAALTDTPALNFGSDVAFTHLAVGTSSATQVFPDQTRHVNFSVSGVRVVHRSAAAR